jgi:Fe-Mn family superoxide dismutase
LSAYSLPDLPYDFGALEPHYSGKILELHHDKHHQAYVTGLNATLDKLAEARSKGDFGAQVGLEKTLAFNLSGHILHSMFWENLSPAGGGEPQGDLAAAVADQFGSFDAFKAEMSQATIGVQGSGWGALAWEPLGKRLIVQQIYDHQGNVGQNTTNLLVFDAWEHAYYLQYLNVRGDYVKALWNIVNWDDVEARFKAARA